MRRDRRRERVAQVMAAGQVEAALDVLALMDLAWHDCYGDPSPPDRVVDDALTVSRGDLGRLASAALLGVIDWRDLRVGAEAVESEDP